MTVPETTQRNDGLRFPARTIWWVVLFLLGIFACLLIGWPDRPRTMPRREPPARGPGETQRVTNLASFDARNVKPISAPEAVAINAATPVTVAGDTAAAPFSDRSPAQARTLALQCLASAIYHEAGSEPTDGQRAVAQVILNRVRHPVYPSSICGVVHQGAQLATGCQFTFMCDGSLARRPSRSGWLRAQAVAQAALSGQVFAPVGHATHYHADWVVPYWAASLDKVATVGRHIFYRWAGGPGRAAAFRQLYAQAEPGQAAPAAVVESPALLTPGPERVTPEPQTQPTSNPVIRSGEPTQPTSRLLADVSAGTLIHQPLAPKSKPSPVTQLWSDQKPCVQSRRIEPLKPVGAAASGSQEIGKECL